MRLESAKYDIIFLKLNLLAVFGRFCHGTGSGFSGSELNPDFLDRIRIFLADRDLEKTRIRTLGEGRNE